MLSRKSGRTEFKHRSNSGAKSVSLIVMRLSVVAGSTSISEFFVSFTAVEYPEVVGEQSRFVRACILPGNSLEFGHDNENPRLAQFVTTAAHPNVIAGETPTLSPFAPASPTDLDKQHELGQFLTLVSDTSPLLPLPIRCGEGDLASLFEIPRSEVHLLDAGTGAGAPDSPTPMGFRNLCRANTSE